MSRLAVESTIFLDCGLSVHYLGQTVYGLIKKKKSTAWHNLKLYFVLWKIWASAVVDQLAEVAAP